jgi:NADPH:quinone reductase-like Zn-dependent oxidoreductase
LYFLRLANLRPGQKILINGAGGSIGTLAIQLARRQQAEVTAVDNTDKLELLRKLGAQHVIDYTAEGVFSHGRRYDAILDVPGKLAYGPALRALNETGVYLIANPRPSHQLRGRWSSLTGRKRVICWHERAGAEELRLLQEMGDLVAAGEIRPVIDRCYPLAETAAAHRYVETGRKQGNVLITHAQDEGTETHSP